MKKFVIKLITCTTLLGFLSITTNLFVSANSTYHKVKQGKNNGTSHYWTSKDRTIKTSKPIRAYDIKADNNQNVYATKSKIIPKGSIIEGSFSITVPGGFQIYKGDGIKPYSKKNPNEWIINPSIKNEKNPYNTYWISKVK
ncbi:hypothetical protein [Lactobacillus sp. Sy-1]|uniref:hypothetical protein n=1 Tax=Lactobacillus sp. Sy-1 TaxID=2109645 RepID=UPI001C55A50D|nr:hypothetical protein [Lactobacillus sp. Sy-1]MBW1605047.1 hypothetical protein [Lactobacillus sp. Sy-1]